MKISTSYLCPSIPIRDFDWHATIEGHEGEGINGFGRTEQEAIEDLQQNMECIECTDQDSTCYECWLMSDASDAVQIRLEDMHREFNETFGE